MAWHAPAGSSISCASVQPGLVLLSCAKLLALTALALIPDTSSASPFVFQPSCQSDCYLRPAEPSVVLGMQLTGDVAVPRPPGKRKRQRQQEQRSGAQLEGVATCSMAAELSCIHGASIAAGACIPSSACDIGSAACLSSGHPDSWTELPLSACWPAGLLVMVGSYEPALELLLLLPQQHCAAGTWHFQRMARLAGQALSTTAVPGEAAAAAEVEKGTDIPQSLLLLPQPPHPPHHAGVQVPLPFSHPTAQRLRTYIMDHQP